MKHEPFIKETERAFMNNLDSTIISRAFFSEGNFNPKEFLVNVLGYYLV